MNEKGFLSLILHAHLPFVRHPEYETFLEEGWLFEAITETYIPLLNMMDGLVKDNVPFRLTMSVTPPLASMLNDELLQSKYLKHLNLMLELADKELKRTKGLDDFFRLAQMYFNKLQNCKEVFEKKYFNNLTFAFKKFQDLGVLEIITCCATHGFLPLMIENKDAIKAQIDVAANSYERIFGKRPNGIWLAECGYTPLVDKYLKDAGIKFFIMDTHGVQYANPRPKYGVFAPVYTSNGVAAFGRDTESSKQVWSANEGYPGDINYRDFYRDIGFDLEYDYIKPYINGDGVRVHTGFKYYKITGKTDNKLPYNPDIAHEMTASHAGNFMFNREKQIESLCSLMDRKPIIISPYDAELFGHWWYEGPSFLNYLIRKIAFDQNTIKLISPIDYLQEYEINQLVKPNASSWGYKGYNEYWLNGSNDWVYRHLHKISKRMVEIANQYKETNDPLVTRSLNQAAREVLLAQSSDWAFIMKTGSMVEYAVKRTKDHILRFNQIYEDLKYGSLNEQWLSDIEYKDNIFPEINFRSYCS
ncbi:MAG: 1,4-alpha-glucan branching protein domain-containing protein [Pseudomonadota bacterium]